MLITEYVPTSCSLQHASHINSRTPLATRICRESRSVALLAGFTEIYDGDFLDSDAPEWRAMNKIDDLWVTSTIDVLHLNYENCYNDGWYTHSGNPLQFLLWLVQRLGHFTRMSISAPLVLGFDHYDGAEYMGEPDENLDLLAEAGGLYLTTLCVVNLHPDLDSALRMEGGMLFGRLGEERVRLVEVGDKTTLQAYYNLWATGPVEDREPAQFFDLALSRHESEWLPRVAQWRERLVTKWVNHYWYKALKKNNRADIQNQQGVWRALKRGEKRVVLKDDPGPFSDYMRPSRVIWRGFGDVRTEVPNKAHPWVAGVLCDMPCFQPVVMFRFCEDKCYAPRPPRPKPVRGSRGTGTPSRGSV